MRVKDAMEVFIFLLFLLFKLFFLKEKFGRKVWKEKVGRKVWMNLR